MNSKEAAEEYSKQFAHKDNWIRNITTSQNEIYNNRYDSFLAGHSKAKKEENERILFMEDGFKEILTRIHDGRFVIEDIIIISQQSIKKEE